MYYNAEPVLQLETCPSLSIQWLIQYFDIYTSIPATILIRVGVDWQIDPLGYYFKLQIIIMKYPAFF